jgi:hypothetical protein
MTELWQVKLPYATFGITVSDNEVIDAAPIGLWMVGKLFPRVQLWVANKGGSLNLVAREYEDGKYETTVHS